MSRRYDDYDDYESGGFQKFRSKKPKNKFKGHQGRSKGEGRAWANILNEDEVFTPYQPEPVREEPIVPQSRNQNTESRNTNDGMREKKTFVFGPNTITVKGIQIDLDRVDDIKILNTEHNGRMTFGIQFVFTGNKGLSRIVWFNSNQRERDASYSENYRKWLKVKGGK